MVHFYNRSMERAAAILFGVALLLILFSILSALIPYLAPADDAVMDMRRRAGSGPLIEMLNAGYMALGSAAWPFFGAAVLWRMDRWSRAREVLPK